MSSDPESTTPACDVLVLGASFAGIEVLLQLQRRSPRPLRVVVVDRQSRHGYVPLVHERLCGRIDEAKATLDTRAFVESLPGVEMRVDEVVGFDPAHKRVTLGSGEQLTGRFVVVALGSELAPPPALPGAEHLLRYKLGPEFERARARLGEVLGGAAEGSGGSEGSGGAPPVWVVGGGISGVELAGELAHLDPRGAAGWRRPAVTLVSAAPMLLPELGEAVGRRATEALREQGVTVRLGARLVGAGPDHVVVREGADSERAASAVTLWAGGVRPAAVLGELGLPRTDDGWLRVGPTLQCFATPVPDQPDVFACGDAVRVVGGTGRWNTMQRAIECLWQAKVVARNIVTLAEEAPHYPDGVPSLRPHVLRERFAYGVSLGARSLVVYGPLRVDMPGINTWFRRWLMRQYFERYAPRSR